MEISDRSLNSKMQFTNDYTNMNSNGQNSVTSFNTIQAVNLKHNPVFDNKYNNCGFNPLLNNTIQNEEVQESVDNNIKLGSSVPFYFTGS
jgi:hypothetical protein